MKQMPANYNEKFLEAFKGFEEYYIIIGGTATSIILESKGLDSRSTKDYDMVIIDDKKDKEFYEVITTFLEEGNYTPEVSENNQLFRFTTENEAFPKMIELFSKEPLYALSNHSRTVPLSFEDEMSLSALLLDTDYYDFLTSRREIIEGYPVLNSKAMIVFKAKAWIDLTERKESGARVDSKNIKKHLNDIARLLGSLENTNKLEMPDSIQNDMQKFISLLQLNSELIPQNDAIDFDRQEILELLDQLLG